MLAERTVVTALVLVQRRNMGGSGASALDGEQIRVVTGVGSAGPDFGPDRLDPLLELAAGCSWPQQRPPRMVRGNQTSLLPHPGWGRLTPRRGRFQGVASYKRDALLRLQTVRRHIAGVIGMGEDQGDCADVM